MGYFRLLNFSLVKVLKIRVLGQKWKFERLDLLNLPAEMIMFEIT